MASEQKQDLASTRGRSLSRQILGDDFDLVQKYASKYNNAQKKPGHLKRTQTYTAVPSPYGSNGFGGQYGAYSGYGGGGGGYHHHSGYSTGYGSGSSASSSGSYSTNKRKNRRTPSNLINPSTIGQWDSSNVDSQEKDMSAAMTAMVSSYQTRLTEEAAFLDQIQDEADGNADFAKPENAENWNVKEVCYWLNKIHLDKYIRGFRDQIIDGSILLRDLDEAMLINELGIKRLHVKKILREIAKLKQKSPKLKKESNDTRDELIQTLRKEINELKSKNKALQLELAQVKGIGGGKGSYTNVFSGYKSQY